MVAGQIYFDEMGLFIKNFWPDEPITCSFVPVTRFFWFNPDDSYSITSVKTYLTNSNMARLTTFSRLLITIAIVVGVFFAVRTFLPGLSASIGKKAQNTETAAPQTETGNSREADNGNSNSTWGSSGNNASSDNETTAPAKSDFTPAAFKYTPPTPVGGKLKAVVELGATGFNYFIVRIDGQKNWQMEKDVFGVSLVKEGLATDDDIKIGLKRYINEILEFGVGPRDIHFVISSGAKKSDVIDKIISELKRMNYVVNTVTAEQEAKLALRAAITRDYQSSAFVVDIGSGTQKLRGSTTTPLRVLRAMAPSTFRMASPTGWLLTTPKPRHRVCLLPCAAPALLSGACRSNWPISTAMARSATPC